jgi:hypothetical protein
MSTAKTTRRSVAPYSRESLASFHVTDAEWETAAAELGIDPRPAATAPGPMKPKAPEPPAVAIFHDRLLQSLVVVQVGDKWHLVPNQQGGWSRRLPLNMSDEARSKRLWLADDVTASYLGVPTHQSEQSQ